MSKVLVAYFSASGVTAAVAKRLADGIGADLFEILPKPPYTAADLDWRNKQSRSTIEMEDRAARPPIQGCVEQMAQYDTVFVGFPVWWYREPSVIDTFMEAHDFTGKTVVPFATSGGSDIGDAGANMQAIAAGAKVEAGKRFPSQTDTETLAAWAGAWL